MRKIVLCLLLLFTFQNVFGQNKKNHNSELAFRIAERDLIPEGIAYDPVSGSFFIGSVRKSKIMQISRDGIYSTFIPKHKYGLWQVIGMRVDAERRILWANSANGDYMNDYDINYPDSTGIFKFDLNTKTLIKKYIIKRKAGARYFNDLTVAKDGSVFATTVDYSVVYKIDQKDDVLTEFLKMPGNARINGIDISPDSKYLFVTSNEDLQRVTIVSKQVDKLISPSKDKLGFVDGLYYYKNSLIAVQTHVAGNKRSKRIVRYFLDKDGIKVKEIKILEADHPLFNIPTTGAIVDNWFYYLAATNLNKYNQNAELAPWEDLSDIIVLKVKIED